MQIFLGMLQSIENDKSKAKRRDLLFGIRGAEKSSKCNKLGRWLKQLLWLLPKIYSKVELLT